jgi:iron(III) transport system substrate-binding protein
MTTHLKRWPAAVLAALLVACTPPGPGPAAEPDPQPDPEAAQVATADPGARLIVYSGRSESLVGPMIEAFEEESGIGVDVRWGDTGEIAATLLEEGASTPADVFLSQDPGGLGAVEGLLGPIGDTLLRRVPAGLRPASGLWVPLTGRARVIVYNTANVDASALPSSLEDLTGAAWKARVGWAPTNASFQAMVTAMRELWGEARTRDWLAGMIANGVHVYEGNAPIVAAVGAGEIDAGLVNHYYLYRFLAEEGQDFPARNHFLRDGGPGSLVLLSGAGILAGARHRAAAEEFVAYMLSDEVQRRFVAETHEYPVVEAVTPPADLPAIDELDSPQIDVGALAGLRDTVALLRDVGALP